MVESKSAAGPSPQLFFETVNAYQRTAALKAAIELDVFTAIGEGEKSPQELAAECGTAERGIRILCDYLVVLGFLTKQGNRYQLTQDSAAFLNRKSPMYVGGAINFLLLPTLTDNFKDLAAVVRKGGTVVTDEGTISVENPIWVEFARSMAPMTTLPAQKMAQLVKLAPDRKSKVLDIAAGHGKFGIAFGAAYPKAEIVALDWASVLEVARENARAAGLESRFRTIPGSAFDAEYGSDYDVVLLTNFLHHFDIETCEKLLRRVKSALRKGGSAVVLDFVPNEDRVTPPMAASFSLMMLGSTPSGDAYTFSEYERMFSNAGFAHTELHTLQPTFSSVVIAQT